MKIACIVEGHGEVEAVPVLLRRLTAWLSASSAEFPKPVRVPKERFLKNASERERIMRLASAKAGPTGAVLVLLDSDDGCAVKAGEDLRRHLSRTDDKVRVGIVFAVREFEAWFLAAARSLRGTRGLPLDLEPPVEAEAIRGAKEWIASKKANGYIPTRDQASLADACSLEQCMSARSFRKLVNELQRLLAPVSTDE